MGSLGGYRVRLDRLSQRCVGAPRANPAWHRLRGNGDRSKSGICEPIWYRWDYLGDDRYLFYHSTGTLCPHYPSAYPRAYAPEYRGWGIISRIGKRATRE